jgi:pSer/pThr/pTyr-binding forkhead associated (FHA) protein
MSSGQFKNGPDEAGDRSSDPESSVGRYCLRVGPRRIVVHPGENFVGRDDTCQVMVTGALVSRQHARFVLERGELCVEDLGSTNGTFVNNARIQGRVPVQHGDRIFVGSTEIEVVWEGSDIPSSGTLGDDPSDRMTPSSGAVLVGRVAVTRELEHWEAVTERGPRSGLVDFETIDSAVRLAERMFAMGRPLAGRDILAEPLSRVLALARDGEHLEPTTVDAAGRGAVKLALEVFDANWVDVAVEIHLHAGHPMRTETLEQIVVLRKKAPIGDDALIARYYARICAMIGFMPLAERLLYAELAGDDPPQNDDE